MATAGTLATAAVLLPTTASADVNPALFALRIVAALLLAFVLPGYALSIAILPPDALGSRWDGGWLSRGMWACGLSLAVTVLGGLALNLTSAGLTGTTWTIFLGTVTLLAAAAAVTRVRRTSAAGPVRRFRMPSARASASAVGGCVLGAVLLAAVAIRIAQVSAEEHDTADFAQLWLIPAGNSAATVGVRNDYPGRRRFHLVLRRGANVAATWDLGLSEGQTWRTTVRPAAPPRLSAELTMPGHQAAPRIVEITTAGEGR